MTSGWWMIVVTPWFVKLDELRIDDEPSDYHTRPWCFWKDWWWSIGMFHQSWTSQAGCFSRNVIIWGWWLGHWGIPLFMDSPAWIRAVSTNLFSLNATYTLECLTHGGDGSFEKSKPWDPLTVSWLQTWVSVRLVGPVGGAQDLFYREGWEYILEKHGGRLPVKIKAGGGLSKHLSLLKNLVTLRRSGESAHYELLFRVFFWK